MKKKGFTLIELLAVIIVIAVIAIITVPTILGVIDKSKRAAYKDSIYGIIDSARIYLATNQETINGEIEFVCDGINCSRQDNGDNLLFKGTVPKSGSIYLQADGSVLVESVYNGKYYANNETGEVVITEADTTLTRGELTKKVTELEKEIISLKNQQNQTNSEIGTINNKINNIQANITSIDRVYPVGSIYISTSNVDPATLFKGTTWERYAENRTLVGTSTTAEQTGGSSTATLTIANLPSHDHTVIAKGTVDSTFTGTPVDSGIQSANHVHTFSGTTVASGIHQHSISNLVLPNEGSISGNGYFTAGGNNNYWKSTFTTISNKDGQHTHEYGGNTLGNSVNHTHSVTATGTVSSTFKGTSATTSKVGSGSEINIQNPYITVYMWKRIS